MYNNYKFRIYPNQKQKEILDTTFKSYKFVYNFWLDRKKQEDKKWREDKNISYELRDWGEELKTIKKIIDYSFLNEVEYACLQRALFNLNNDLKSYRRRKKGYPKEIPEYRNYYITGSPNHNVYLGDGIVKLPKVKKVKANLYREIPDSWVIKNARVEKTIDNKYYVTLLYEYFPLVELKEIKTTTILEHTFRGIYKNKDGEIIKFPEHLLKLENKLKNHKNKQARMVYNSSNWKKQAIKIEKIKLKINNYKRNYLHHITKELADKYDCIKIKYPQPDELYVYVEDYLWITFVGMLNQKLHERGKKLIKI